MTLEELLTAVDANTADTTTKKYTEKELLKAQQLAAEQAKRNIIQEYEWKFLLLSLSAIAIILFTVFVFTL